MPTGSGNHGGLATTRKFLNGQPRNLHTERQCDFEGRIQELSLGTQQQYVSVRQGIELTANNL